MALTVRCSLLAVVEQPQVGLVVLRVRASTDLLARAPVLAVAHLVAAVGQRSGDLGHVAAGSDHLAAAEPAHELAQEVEVERVLGALIASEVTFARQRAATPRPMVKIGRVDVAVGIEQRQPGLCRAAGPLRERHRDRRWGRLQAGVLQRGAKRLGLWDRVGAVGHVHRGELGEHRPVPGLELSVGDRPLAPAVGLIGTKRLRRLWQHHVGVDQRAAAEAAGDDRRDMVELQDLEQPEFAAPRIPDVVAHLPWRAPERTGGIGGTALEHQHALDL